MPNRLPPGVQISIARRSLPSDYQMPTMDMSTDHYSVGLLLSGDRRTITEQQSYDAHAGDVSTMPPFLYHRTVSLSSVPYESYLVKFTSRAVEPLLELLGHTFLDEMFEEKIHHFPEAIQKRLEWLLDDMLTVFSSRAPYNLNSQKIISEISDCNSLHSPNNRHNGIPSQTKVFKKLFLFVG